MYQNLQSNYTIIIIILYFYSCISTVVFLLTNIYIPYSAKIKTPLKGVVFKLLALHGSNIPIMNNIGCLGFQTVVLDFSKSRIPYSAKVKTPPLRGWSSNFRTLLEPALDAKI